MNIMMTDESEDAFFGDGAMEDRAPTLFHAMLGAHIERSVQMDVTRIVALSAAAVDDGSGPSSIAEGSSPARANTALSSMLMGALQRQMHAEARGDAMGRGERSSDGEGNGEGAQRTAHAGGVGESVGSLAARSADGLTKVSMLDDTTDIPALRAELRRVMGERFMRGEDAAFYDYRTCDTNEKLDIGPEADNDYMDAYFGERGPDEMSPDATAAQESKT
jgi:hypothetical protein